MRRVENIKRGASGFKNYPDEIAKNLKVNFGCDGAKGNFKIDSEYSEDRVKAIRDLISSEDGMYQVYAMWYSKPIKSWRLIFGYE